MINSYVEVLRKYAMFDGRAGRAEYWWFALANLIVWIVLAILAAAAGTFFTVVLALYFLGTFIPSLAVQVRRLHDTNRSGWWLLIELIPLVGPIVLLVFVASAGTPGPNQYGPPIGAAPVQSSPFAHAVPVSPTATKTCPRCAETVQAAAQVCRFCGYSFVAVSEQPAAEAPPVRHVITPE